MPSWRHFIMLCRIRHDFMMVSMPCRLDSISTWRQRWWWLTDVKVVGWWVHMTTCRHVVIASKTSWRYVAMPWWHDDMIYMSSWRHAVMTTYISWRYVVITWQYVVMTTCIMSCRLRHDVMMMSMPCRHDKMSPWWHVVISSWHSDMTSWLHVVMSYFSE